MADNRGMRFPGHQQPGAVPAYGMMPTMGVQYVPTGMQPGHPMMQQQMMAPPGVLPQMYPMQQMAMRGVAPPPYTPQMAQTYHLRGNPSRPSRPQKELSEKEKQFQLQQQRLKQFGRPGAITADADKLIANMFGSDKPKPKQPQKQQSQAPQTTEDDSFGDFMQGPSLTSMLPPQTTPPSTSTPTHLDNGQVANNAGQTGTDYRAQASVPQPGKKPKEEKKAPDLTAMMMECSDLNAPQKAKQFHKPSLKEVQVEHHSSLPVFHQSDHARQWNRQDNLDGLFASEPLPPPQPPKPTKRRHSSGAGKAVVAKTSAGLPVWCEAPDEQLPPLYRHVMEASTVDGKIETDRVYPILILSGLPREALGTIWQMANKETPGRLIKSELYAVLALIALAQNNFNVGTLDILLRCPQPPVPFLGPQSVAMPTQPPANQGQVQVVCQPMTAAMPGNQAVVAPNGEVANQGQWVGAQQQVNHNVATIPHTNVHGEAAELPQMPPNVPHQMPPNVPHQMPPNVPHQMPPNVPHQMPPNVPHQMPPNVPHQMPPNVPHQMPPNVPHQMPPNVPHQMPPNVPQHVPSHVPPQYLPQPQPPVHGIHQAVPPPQPAQAHAVADDDFADFQTAPTAATHASKQAADESFGDFIGGTTPVVNQQLKDEKPPFIICAPKVDPEMEVVSPDDKYNSNVRSFFCSSDSSTAEPSKLNSDLKGQSTPSLDDEDYTDCRDSSQISTSEQSENEDIRAFESYVEEFHRKKEEREQRTPQHRDLPKQKSHIVQPQPKIPTIPQSIPSIPPLSQGPKLPSSDEFTDFKSAQNGSSLFKPVPSSKNVYASQVAKAKQTVMSAAQKLASEASSEFTDFQEAPKTSTGAGGGSVAAADADLMGEEDKYNALRVLGGDDIPVVSIFSQPKQEEENFANFEEEGEEDWSGFAEAASVSESAPKEGSLRREASSVSVDNASVLSLYGSERGEERDWADFESAGGQSNEEKSSASAEGWAAFGTSEQGDQAVTGESTSEGWTTKSNSAFSVVKPKELESKLPSDGLYSVSDVSSKTSDDWGGFTESHIPGDKDAGTQQGQSDWSDFHASDSTVDPSKILTVKKENLQTKEVLNVFKVRDETLATFSYKLSSKTQSTVRIPSTESDIDDDRIPPPMDNMDDDDDHNAFSRGYDLDDMVRHTVVTKGYSAFGISSHHYSVTRHKHETKTTDSLRSSEERGHSMSPEIQQTETDSSSSKDMDSWGWKDKVQGVREDSQSVSSLEFPSGKGNSTQKDSDNGGTDSQSVSSIEFGNFESSSKAAESKSVDSLELYKKEDLDAEEDQQNGAMPHPVLAQTILGGGEMRALADKYNIDGEVQGSNNHEYEWERCIDNCCRMIKDANNTFNSVSRSAVCNEVIKSSQGSEYVSGIIEIYRVSCRIMAAMTGSGIRTPALERLMKDIDLAWNNLTAFFVGASVLPEPTTLNFFHAVMKSDSKVAQQKACGVCLLDVDAKSKSFKEDEEIAKLTYGGRQYHAPCANFWINCVDSTLPALRLPELL